MTDPGLSNRLQQHSRRAGLNVGVTMALAIAICILGFSTIYAQLTPLLRDFVGQEARSDADRVSAPANDDEQDDVAAAPAQPTPTTAPAAAPAAPTTPAIAPAAATQPSEVFEPDLQSNSATAVNLRSSPGIPADNPDANILTTLPLAAPLQFLDEEQTVNGEAWLRVRTEDGREGWILGNATEPYDPSA